LGSAAEISSLMDKSEKLVEAYTAIGTPAEITKTIDKP
jgi:hypothetical protein